MLRLPTALMDKVNLPLEMQQIAVQFHIQASEVVKQWPSALQSGYEEGCQADVHQGALVQRFAKDQSKQSKQGQPFWQSASLWLRVCKAIGSGSDQSIVGMKAMRHNLDMTCAISCYINSSLLQTMSTFVTLYCCKGSCENRICIA